MAKRKQEEDTDLQPLQQQQQQSNNQSLGSTSTLNKHVKLELSPSHLMANSQSTIDPATSLPIKPKDPPKMIMLPEYLHSVSTQKRRRVVRACDRCRKLKIKCSGDQPCIHCTVYNYECTYDQPNKSKRKVPPVKKETSNKDSNASDSSTPNLNTQQAILPNESTNAETSSSMDRFSSSTVSILASSNPEIFAKLTDRLKLYDDILHRLLPEIKLTDLNDNPKPINPMKLMSALNKLRDSGKYSSRPTSKQISKAYDSLPDIPLPVIPITKLPPNQIANPQIQPPQPLRQNQLTSPPQAPLKSASTLNNMYQDIDGSVESTMGKEIKIILPSREVALDLITKTWENACVLFRFYHRVAFIEDLNELYDTDPNQYTNKQQRFLPLVYSVMACGALFYKSDKNTIDSKYKNTNGGIGDHREKNENNDGEFIEPKDFDDEGYKYFIAARKLIDITDTRDTYGIQTIVMLIIFLQCSARLSTCYAYIGIALRAALREGLHRKLDYPFNPIELEIRKRLFWTIYKMDIYVNTMLGLPRTISSDDFDQDLPEELDDENITISCYRFDKQQDRLSSSGIANAHTKLILLMREVVTKLYPIKPKKTLNIHEPSEEGVAEENGATNSNNQNNNKKQESQRNNFVYDLELKLQEWMNSLPIELKPGVEPAPQYLKANRLLHISYLHVKIILYRPFIHYISSNFKSNSKNDLTCIENAKNCINVARVVVKLAEDMIDKDMLSGSYWFSIYTIFFSVACLVYYVHFAPSINKNGKLDFEYIAIKKDAEKGKKVLDILKDSSMAARRTYNILNALFEQLNRKTARAGSRNNRKDSSVMRASTESPSNGGKYASEFNNFSNANTPSMNLNSQVGESMMGINRGKSISPMIDPDNSTNMNNMYYGMNNMEMNNMNMPMNVDINDIDMNMNMNMNTDMNLDLNDIVDMNYNNETPKQNGLNDITEYNYVQGPMDQMDMKIFGRFLPPYMLNKGMEESGEIKEKEKEKEGEEEVVFEPSLGLFSFVEDAKSSAKGDFSSKEKSSNAIPSGLSTVYQSETDKNPAVLSDDGSDVKADDKVDESGRFTNQEGIGMLDELLFGSAWD